MCTSCMKKRKQKRGGRKTSRRSGRRVSGIGMVGVSMETLGGIAAGAVASKALNGVAKNVKALQSKPIILPVAKIAIGYIMFTRSDNEFIRNMGGGFVAEGGLSALDVLAPNVFKGGLAAGTGIGAVIDLDEPYMSGYGDMQIEQQVAGTFGYDEVNGVI